MLKLIVILIPLLIGVESGGDCRAVGDFRKDAKTGKMVPMSRGCLQISKAYWQDAMEVLDVDWKYETEVWDRKKSIAVTTAYLIRWGKHYKKKTGKEPTLEVLARMHNSGPNGWKKKCTIPYWNKVKRRMK